MDTPQPLSPDEIDVVMPRLPGWTIEGESRITKEFQFLDRLPSAGRGSKR